MHTEKFALSPRLLILYIDVARNPKKLLTILLHLGFYMTIRYLTITNVLIDTYLYYHDQSSDEAISYKILLCKNYLAIL